MVFYINGVTIPNRRINYNERCIGLFDNNSWKGEGSCCGWYGAEYYLDTTLLAYGVQLYPGNQVPPKDYPFDGGVFELKEYYNKIAIGSVYQEVKFEAPSVEAAIEIFKEQRWEQFPVHKK